MPKNSFHQLLPMPGMLSVVRECFDRVPDPLVSQDVTLTDSLMSGLAMFCLKVPSLLDFGELDPLDEDYVEVQNLKSLFGMKRVPFDTTMRERLDDVDTCNLWRCFTQIHSFLQRRLVLENWTVLGGYHLIAINSTGYHYSHKVKCKNCCVKNHRNGSKTYYHQMLGAAMIHPDHGEVLPLAPEPVRKNDGKEKNDSERKTAKRLLDRLRQEHPYLKAIIVEDTLASNGPHINYLKNKDFRFILGAKPGDHKPLFSWFQASETRQSWEILDKETNTVQRFEWDNGLPLDDANFDLKVNMLKYEETDKKGKTKWFSWVTDLPLNRDTVMLVMQAGRRRWAIESETSNTLKAWNVYDFEHNYGHGNNHLTDVLATLAMLAFLLDQVQQHCCPLFQQARAHQKRNLYFWDSMRSLFRLYRIRDWRTFYLAMSGKTKKSNLAELLPDGPK